MMRYIILVFLMLGLAQAGDTKVGIQKNSAGVVVLRVEMKGDLYHGLLTVYNDQGKKEATRYYVNGKRHGQARDYYTSGQVRAEWLCVDGAMEGRKTHYRRDGSIKGYKEYKAGELEGVVLSLDNRGDTIMYMETHKGKKHGRYILYYENNVIDEQANFVDGHLADSPILYRDSVSAPLKTFKSTLEEKGVCQVYEKKDSSWVHIGEFSPSSFDIKYCSHY